MTARRVFVGMVACLASVNLALADGESGEKAERARLAEILLDRAEALAARPFDGRFRAAAARALAQLPAEELEAREARVSTAGLGPLAIGASDAQLVYTPVAPCRIVDTRVAGGTIAAGAVREFRVTGGNLSPQGGDPNGCGVPVGPATSAIINFVAVNPAGAGNLRAWAYTTPPVGPPGASVLNFAAVGMNIANGIAVPICDPSETTCTYDLRVQADGSGTHLVADVVGFFERFPKEQAHSFAVRAATAATFNVGGTCVHIPGAAVSITAPAAGRVYVHAHANVEVNHVNGSNDQITLSVTPTQAACETSGPGIGQARVANNYPNGAIRTTVITQAAFEVDPGTYTYYLNGIRVGSAVMEVLPVTLTATFHPD